MPERHMYPQTPGYKGCATSQAAATAIAPRVATLRASCLTVLARYPDGLTADEVADVLQKSVLAIRPRMSELFIDNKVMDTGIRRSNESGRPAAVWQVSP